MREILFRGKAENIGIWVYGWLLKDRSGHIMIQDAESFEWYTDIDPATIGQYTGLQDKNGKKIFDGDIVRCAKEWSKDFDDEDCAIRVVKYGMDNYGRNHFVYGWYFEQNRIDYDDDYSNMPGIYDKELPVCLSNCLVVGNIHDNPKLLEVK